MNQSVDILPVLTLNLDLVDSIVEYSFRPVDKHIYAFCQSRIFGAIFAGIFVQVHPGLSTFHQDDGVGRNMGESCQQGHAGQSTEDRLSGHKEKFLKILEKILSEGQAYVDRLAGKEFEN